MSSERDTFGDEFWDIDLEREAFPLFLRDPETGHRQGFVLRELMGPDRDAYMNEMSSRARYDRQGNPLGLKKYDRLQATALARGLFEADLEEVKDDDGKVIRIDVKEIGKKVDAKVIDKWPSRVQSKLFDKLAAMSGLTDDSEETAGNS